MLLEIMQKLLYAVYRKEIQCERSVSKRKKKLMQSRSRFWEKEKGRKPSRFWAKREEQKEGQVLAKKRKAENPADFGQKRKCGKSRKTR